MNLQSKEKTMTQLFITENDLKNNKEMIFEKCFCVALLQQPTDITSRVLNDYLKLRELFYPDYSSSVSMLFKKQDKCNCEIITQTSPDTARIKLNIDCPTHGYMVIV